MRTADLSAEEEAAAASQGEEEEEEDAEGSSSDTFLITDNRSGKKKKKMCAFIPSVMPTLCSLRAVCGFPAAGCARWRNQLVQTMKLIISVLFFCFCFLNHCY